MVKKTKEEIKVLTDEMKEQEKLLEECQGHEHDSSTWLQPLRDTWEDKESMLIVKLNDSISKNQKSQVFNPVLSTAVIERSARVMAQPQSGMAFAVSKNDVGKNLLMNMLLKHYVANANEEYSYLLKLRFLDLYSNVYGSFFGLVPWRVNTKEGYIGPEILPINMRDVRPQPGRRNIGKSDWFGVRSVSSIDWLKSQDRGVWNREAIDSIAQDLKNRKSSGASGQSPQEKNRSLVEKEHFPSVVGDSVFPDVEMYTEYRSDMWITWTPQIVDIKTSRPHILRVVKNPYPYGMLPIVAKHAFPLLDSIIGLGEFERGKTLQFAMNSLINLYLDGVKYSIFPPLHINLNEVVPSSIKWGAGEKWYMNHPNTDVQAMVMRSTEWTNTFQSTYGFLASAISNLAGTTQVTSVPGVEMAMGKTPDAIKAAGFRESARDEWDRFMMEDTIRQVMERWLALVTHKLDVPTTMRVFGPEIKDLQKTYPDDSLLKIFRSGERGNLVVDKIKLNGGKEPIKYDYELVTGSTMKSNTADEGEVASGIIKDIIAAPQLLQEIRAKGKDIDVAELFKRRMVGGGVKDWDKILIETSPATTSAGVTTNVLPVAGNGQVPPGAANAMAQVTGGATPSQNANPAEPMVTGGVTPGSIQFKDPQIQQAAMQIFGGVAGVPAS